jgi:hypothetical protein
VDPRQAVRRLAVWSAVLMAPALVLTLAAVAAAMRDVPALGLAVVPTLPAVVGAWWCLSLRHRIQDALAASPPAPARPPARPAARPTRRDKAARPDPAERSATTWLADLAVRLQAASAVGVVLALPCGIALDRIAAGRFQVFSMVTSTLAVLCIGLAVAGMLRACARSVSPAAG